MPRWLRKHMELVVEPLSVRYQGREYDFEWAISRLPWRHNDLAPHEPRMPPHEYVLKDVDADWLPAYEMAYVMITQSPESYLAYFRAYQNPMRYLEVGDYRYWPTGLGRKRLFLNRCLLDSVEPPRRVDEGARPIPLGEWGAELPYWPQGSGYGVWRWEGRWVFYPTDEPTTWGQDERQQLDLF